MNSLVLCVLEGVIGLEDNAQDIKVVEHYYKYLGRETNALFFHNLPEVAPNPITVMEFAPPSNEYDWVYTTVGASRKLAIYKTPTDTLTGRVEFMIYTRKQYPDITKLLLKLAIYPFLQRTVFRVGDLVPGEQGSGVVEGSPLTEILLTYPYTEPPEFGILHNEDGSHVHILWIIPIYYSERLFAREHGYKELEKLFGRGDVDTSDLWRKAVV
jgi:hypothetical protein